MTQCSVSTRDIPACGAMWYSPVGAAQNNQQPRPCLDEKGLVVPHGQGIISRFPKHTARVDGLKVGDHGYLTAGDHILREPYRFAGQLEVAPGSSSSTL